MKDLWKNVFVSSHPCSSHQKKTVHKQFLVEGDISLYSNIPLKYCREMALELRDFNFTNSQLY